MAVLLRRCRHLCVKRSVNKIVHCSVKARNLLGTKVFLNCEHLLLLSLGESLDRCIEKRNPVKKSLPLVAVAFVAALSISGCGAPSGGDTAVPSQSSGNGVASGNPTSSSGNSTPSGSNGVATGAPTGSSSGGSADAGQGESSGSGSTQGSNGSSSSNDGPTKVTERPKDASGAVTALQGFLNALDKDMDKSYTGAESSAATDAAKYNSLKAQLPTAVKFLDESSLSPSKSVSLLKVYGKNMKEVAAGVAITVDPSGINLGDNDSVEIKSSSIRVAYEGKPRPADKAGKDTFILRLKDGTWKISDVVITSPMP